jgi:hypothetical protein
MSPVEDSFQPGAFEDPATDEPGSLLCHNVSFRYDWKNNAFAYYWLAGNDAPKRAEIRHPSIAPISIEPIEFERWVDLGGDIPARVKEGLRSSSFLEVVAGNVLPQRVLVREEGMEYKPSLSISLTPEEILEYWSLFSPEQKSAFLSRKLDDLLASAAPPKEGSSGAYPADGEQRSMFDRFAGIFHAFSCLENLVVDALALGNSREARCLLFGSKYDSLKILIERITASETADPVNRYITLLCAFQLLEHLAEHDAKFAEDERKSLDAICRLLKKSIRTASQELMPDLGGRSSEFVEWFEKMFFLDIPAPSEFEDQPA